MQTVPTTVRSVRPLFATASPRLLLVAFAALCVATSAAANPFLDKLLANKRVEANPKETYQLKQTDGPWFVLATTFSGPEAEQQAHELALELRSRYGLPAYVHAKEFKHTGRAPGRGIDKYGKPLPLRYQKQGDGEEIAVLIGDFESIDDPRLDKTLNRVKYLRPDALDVKKRKKTSQNLALMRTLQRKLLPDGSDKKQKGPMGHAFAARNPLLSREYFVPKSVDKFVAKMNAGVEFSLLDCPGRYTIKVATFRGASVIKAGKTAGASLKSQLDQAADKAHRLTVALRDKGLNYEAYEFHDRAESIVTIGSFDTVATVMPDGTNRYAPEALAIFRTFAAGDKPWINPKASQAERAKIAQVSHTFDVVGAGQAGMPVVAGVHPKYLLNIPFDVMPTVYEVPKRSITAAYSRRAR